MADSGLKRFLGQGIRFATSKAATVYVALKLASDPSSSFTLNLPTALPASGTEALVVDSSGNISTQALGGSGTVTSVAQSLTGLTWLTISGSPITTSGTLALSATSGQTANQVLASPNGSTGTVSLRSLVAADIPTLTAAKISDFDTQVRTSRLDQMAAPSTSVSLNSQKITNLLDPTSAQDAATKAYVDSVVVSAVVYKGTADASAANPTAATGVGAWSSGWMYRVTTAGSTAFGFLLNVGDFVIYNGSTWNKIDSTDPAVTGTSNRISVSATSDTSYAVDIAATYVGQTSITTLGTIATGVWNGTDIAVADGGTGASTAAGARTNLSAAGIYKTSFTNASLTAGVLTVTHNLAQYGIVQVFDNSDKMIIPDEVTMSSSTACAVDLTSFGTLSGTWNVVVTA